MDPKFVEIDPNSGPSRQSYVEFVEGKSPAEVRWWTKDTVAVVTGANKGIGFEIVRQLAKEGVTTILTARDETRGLEAADKLKAEGLENVVFYPLDVTDPASAAKLANWIKEKFGGIDILVNNAGVASRQEDYDSAKFTISTNYTGQKIVTSALLPLVKPSPAGARIVFVSSELGQFLHCLKEHYGNSRGCLTATFAFHVTQWLKNEKVKQQVSDVDHLTEGALDSISAEYLESVKNGQDSWVDGFGPQYRMSKILLNAYSRVLAKSFSSRPSDSKVYVNAMTPGLTFTDLNDYAGGRTVEHGAETATWLALFPSGGPQGGFFRDRADQPF